MANEKRLIDANVVRNKINSFAASVVYRGNAEMFTGKDTCNIHEYTRGYERGILDAHKIVCGQEPVDAVEVVHGRWIKYKDEKFIGYDADGRIKYRNVYSYNCNKCGHGTAVKSNFCPACGAKMEGVKEVGY